MPVTKKIILPLLLYLCIVGARNSFAENNIQYLFCQDNNKQLSTDHICSQNLPNKNNPAHFPDATSLIFKGNLEKYCPSINKHSHIPCDNHTALFRDKGKK